jgi:hypothetical protein
MSTSNTIKDFLQQCLERTTLMEIVLLHLDVATRPSPIFIEKWDGTSPPIEEFSTRVWEQARDHCSVMGGAQRFRAVATDIQKDKDQIAEGPFLGKSFTVEAGFKIAREDEVSEPPNMTGMLAQFMRHNQEMTRLVTASTGALTSHLARTVERLTAHNEILMNEKVHTLQVMEELYSQKDAREMEKQKVAAEIENRKMMWSKIMELAPIAINKLAGQELVRQRHSNLESTVMTFIETINPQKLDVIAKSGIFSERQMVLFGTILEQVMKTMVTPDQKAEIEKSADRASVGDLGDIGLAAAAAIMGKK